MFETRCRRIRRRLPAVVVVFPVAGAGRCPAELAEVRCLWGVVRDSLAVPYVQVYDIGPG